MDLVLFFACSGENLSWVVYKGCLPEWFEPTEKNLPLILGYAKMSRLQEAACEAAKESHASKVQETIASKNIYLEGTFGRYQIVVTFNLENRGVYDGLVKNAFNSLLQQPEETDEDYWYSQWALQQGIVLCYDSK